MEIFSLIFFFIAVTCVLYLEVAFIKLIYRRYFKKYHKEISEYLRNNNLTLLEFRYPNKLDWENSPFQKPKRFKFSFLIIRVNGTFMSWTRKGYKIIETKEGRLVWMEVETTYFHRPDLTLRIGKKSKKKKARTDREGITKVADFCPACGIRFSESVDECPDCGLNFK